MARHRTGIWRVHCGKQDIESSRLQQCTQVAETTEIWSMEENQHLEGVPWGVIPGREGVSSHSRLLLPGYRQPIIKEYADADDTGKSRIRTTNDDIRSAGTTPGWPGCIASNRPVSPRGHWESCRQPIQTWIEGQDPSRYQKHGGPNPRGKCRPAAQHAQRNGECRQISGWYPSTRT